MNAANEIDKPDTHTVAVSGGLGTIALYFLKVPDFKCVFALHVTDINEVPVGVVKELPLVPDACIADVHGGNGTNVLCLLQVLDFDRDQAACIQHIGGSAARCQLRGLWWGTRAWLRAVNSQVHSGIGDTRPFSIDAVVPRAGLLKPSTRCQQLMLAAWTEVTRATW